MITKFFYLNTHYRSSFTIQPEHYIVSLETSQCVNLLKNYLISIEDIISSSKSLFELSICATDSTVYSDWCSRR